MNIDTNTLIGIAIFLLGVNIGLWTYELWFGRFYKNKLRKYKNLFIPEGKEWKR